MHGRRATCGLLWSLLPPWQHLTWPMGQAQQAKPKLSRPARRTHGGLQRGAAAAARTHARARA